MSVKIRLQRHGKKGKPFFHIVAADARSPRDGKYIERIGSYNPNTNPATIDLDNGKALTWTMKKLCLGYKMVLNQPKRLVLSLATVVYCTACTCKKVY